jgi:hypothetical protein
MFVGECLLDLGMVLMARAGPCGGGGSAFPVLFPLISRFPSAITSPASRCFDGH